jgi:hypothetical protein
MALNAYRVLSNLSEAITMSSTIGASRLNLASTSTPTSSSTSSVDISYGSNLLSDTLEELSTSSFPDQTQNPSQTTLMGGPGIGSNLSVALSYQNSMTLTYGLIAISSVSLGVSVLFAIRWYNARKRMLKSRTEKTRSLQSCAREFYSPNTIVYSQPMYGQDGKFGRMNASRNFADGFLDKTLPYASQSTSAEITITDFSPTTMNQTIVQDEKELQ